jgi:hypothetical protein
MGAGVSEACRVEAIYFQAVTRALLSVLAGDDLDRVEASTGHGVAAFRRRDRVCPGGFILAGLCLSVSGWLACSHLQR